MVEVTYITRNGQTVGGYVSDPASGAGACFAGDTPVKLGADDQVTLSSRPKAGSSILSAAWDYLTGIMKQPSPSVTACSNGAGKASDIWPDGGKPIHPVPRTVEGDAAGDENCAKSGACPIDDGGGWTLPIDDAGHIILPADIFGTDAGTEPIEDAGVPDAAEDAGATEKLPDDIAEKPIDFKNAHFNKYQDAHGITFESDPLTGKGLNDLELQIYISSNSTWLDNMPADGCFPGLIKTTPVPTGEVGCASPYDSFLSCPSDAGNRLTVYVEKVTVTAYELTGGKEVPIGDPVVKPYTSLDPNSPDNPQIDWNNGTKLPAYCINNPKASPDKPLLVTLPKGFVVADSLYFKVKVDLLVQAANYDPNTNNTNETRLDIHFDKVK